VARSTPWSDGERVGSVEMNDTIEIPVEPGRHTLQVRNGRNSSRTLTFDAAEGEVVAFRCTGKRFLPIFLGSFVVPSLPLHSVGSNQRWVAAMLYSSVLSFGKSVAPSNASFRAHRTAVRMGPSR
jgi:hypothetical protein